MIMGNSRWHGHNAMITSQEERHEPDGTYGRCRQNNSELTSTVLTESGQEHNALRLEP